MGWYFVDRALEDFGLNALVLPLGDSNGTQKPSSPATSTLRINTIVFTSTLVAIVMSVTGALARPSLHPRFRIRTARQIGIFLAYALGGLLAAVFIWHGAGITQWYRCWPSPARRGCLSWEQPPATS